MRILLTYLLGFVAAFGLTSCERENPVRNDEVASEWVRDEKNPVFRDLISAENYQVASDPHVFYDESGQLWMVYTGDVDGIASIRLAKGTNFQQWEEQATLLAVVGSSGKDISKETAFYHKAANGKHQLYYIGYEDEDTYQSEIYLAEADELAGPYTQSDRPVVARGSLADKEVYLITSPSVVEHNNQLYMSFLGWNNSPEAVTEVWVIGATSSDGGYTWTDYSVVDTPIGMEGQVTKVNDTTFVAVRTGSWNDKEAIYYAQAAHPWGPWGASAEPILVQQESLLEKDEIIAPQITIDPATGEEYLYYTGADHQTGWWVMLARKK